MNNLRIATALLAFGAVVAALVAAGGLDRILRTIPAALQLPTETTDSAPATSAESSELPPPVESFLAGGVGQAAPQAPAENQFFAQLVGVWQCALRFDDGRVAFPSTWAFKHSLGGFALEHLYFQAKEDLVPPLRVLERDLQSKAITLYDPAARAWRFLGASNVAGSGLGEATQAMTGTLRDGALIFQRNVATREVFANVGHQSFTWREETSADGGATWEVTVLIACRRE